MKRFITHTALAGLLAGSMSLTAHAQGADATISQDTNATCSLSTLNGAYAFYREGWEPAGPMTAVGIVTFDGQGNSQFRQTIRVNGTTTNSLFADGPAIAKYTVTRDCRVKLVEPTGGVFGHAVIANGGNEAYFLSLTGQNTIHGVMKKIN
jgi:hypothetical protein